jgi:hypothetical protein
VDLTGHRFITDLAVRELVAERGAHGQATQNQLQQVMRGSRSITNVIPLGAFAVQRDLYDVFTSGHWSNFAQKHHFMRKFDGQSPFEAYVDGCQWIHGNAVEFAQAAARGRGPAALQALGNACHAVEDSFAGGHVVRIPAQNLHAPGEITHIKRYTGDEKKDHAPMDLEWTGHGGHLSPLGTLAKNTVKALLQLVFEEVQRAAGSRTVISRLAGWESYRQHWIRASSELSKDRDFAYDLVDEFYSGIVWGNTQHATNFDERGCAQAIHQRLSTNTAKVTAVFERLRSFHGVEADDVANHYIEALKAAPTSRVTQAVRDDRALVQLLIKILDEGCTTSTEDKNVAFLKSGMPRPLLNIA